MDDQLKISLVQTDNVWENIEANLMSLTEKLANQGEDMDIIILPELFSTGFTMNAESVAESMEGSAVNWMKSLSREKDSLVIGSVLIEVSGSYFNRLIVAFPDGSIQHYDKRHLFSFAGEDKVFQAGTERLVFEYKGCRICPLVCYDLRFPVWARNTEQIDLLIYVANWPNARMLAWDTLLKARAIENLCYVAGVNRVGVDNNGLVYEGHTAIYNAMGEQTLQTEAAKQGIYSTVLSKSHISDVRDKFRFLQDRDSFEIQRD